MAINQDKPRFGVSIASNGFNDVRPETENNCLFQSVVECHGTASDGWIIVKLHGRDSIFYEIAPDRFIPQSNPKFLAKEVVYVPRKSCEATIYGISWHFKREEYIYSLIIDTKRSSRKYFVDELEKLVSD